MNEVVGYRIADPFYLVIALLRLWRRRDLKAAAAESEMPLRRWRLSWGWVQVQVQSVYLTVCTIKPM
jgi:hypothetical protein